MSDEFDAERIEHAADPIGYWRSKGRNTAPRPSAGITPPTPTESRIASLTRWIAMFKRGKKKAIARGESTEIQDRYIEQWSEEADVLRHNKGAE